MKNLGLDIRKYESVPYYENPFINRNWEMHNIGSKNRITKLKILLKHVEIKCFEQYLLINSNDEDTKKRLLRLRDEF